jgi:lipopolysaccharide transport system ATP-binding protein
MYVRLGFAVAAHVEPDVLLVDEVLAVGDASFRHRCMLRMQELQEGGTTILFVSHSMHMVRRMCSRAVLLSGGRVCAEGSSSDVIAEYEKSLLSAATPFLSGRLPAAFDESSSYIRLTNVTVTSSSGNGSNGLLPISSDASAAIRIEYRSPSARTVGRIDVRIIREDGTLCSAIDGPVHPDNADRSAHELGERGEILIDLQPVQLTTGRYCALVQITDVTDTAVIASGQSDYFAVYTRHTVPSPGIFVPCSRWEHNRLA